MSGYNWQIVAELRFVFTTVECLPQNLPVFYNHTLLGNPENRSVKTMKMITCWTFQHFTTMWQWLQADIDSSVDCSFVYVADCLLPALLVRYFWPDNHPVWLRIRGDIYCFMSEIIFNISNSMWSAKPLGVFFLFCLFNFQIPRGPVSSTPSACVLQLPTQVPLICLRHLALTVPFNKKV